MTTELPRSFATRDALVEFLRHAFPEQAAVDGHVSAIKGGRSHALSKLNAIDPRAYAKTRNHLDGAVTKLSPYLRHGVLTLNEVRQAAFDRAGRDASFKLVNELAWRDYYQRVFDLIGGGVWRDIEPYKTGYASADYATDLPADVSTGTTGLACIDAFVRDLVETGYLHNHARMWFAAYVVHFRRVDWRAGAAFFLTHLLDGDPASNNLSWQWVASTFGNKPYFFNRENLETFTRGMYCATCTERGRCPMEGSYESLQARLFRPTFDNDQRPRVSLKVLKEVMDDDLKTSSPNPPDVRWIHDDAIRSTNNTPALYIFDDRRLRTLGWSLKRIVFVCESLLELPNIRLLRGDTLESLASYRSIETNSSADPFVKQIIHQLTCAGVVVSDHACDPFSHPRYPLDLGRFSRYWRAAERSVMNPTSSR